MARRRRGSTKNREIQTGSFYPPGPAGMSMVDFMSRPEVGITATDKFRDYLQRGLQATPAKPSPSPHRDENVGYRQMMQNQFPFYEDRIVDVARRDEPLVGAMLEQMYDQDPYRGYGELGDNYKPDISVDFLKSGSEADDLGDVTEELWTQAMPEDVIILLKQQGVSDEAIKQIYGSDALDNLTPLGYPPQYS